MYGLVGDQLLEQGGRRIPGDALQLEEPDVEPGRETRFEFAVERTQHRVGLAVTQEVGTQVNEELHALWQSIELGQNAQARGAQRSPQRRLGGPLGIAADGGLVGRVRLGDALGLRPELGSDEAQESRPPGIGQGLIGFGQTCGALARRNLAAERVGTFLELGAQLPQLAFAQVPRPGLLGEQLAYLLNSTSDDSIGHHVFSMRSRLRGTNGVSFGVGWRRAAG